MSTARVFKSGNSQAVRLPKRYRFRSDEVEIFRRGDELVLRERTPKLSGLLARLPRAEGFDEPDDPPPRKRAWPR